MKKQCNHTFTEIDGDCVKCGKSLSPKPLISTTTKNNDVKSYTEGSPLYFKQRVNFPKPQTASRTEIIYMALAVRDAYMGFDQEDYCNEYVLQELFDRDGKCNCVGCIQYKNLIRAYKVAKKYLPKI